MFETTSVSDPWDPYVFGPPGSGSISTRYGSGSFYNLLVYFLVFIFEKWCKRTVTKIAGSGSVNQSIVRIRTKTSRIWNTGVESIFYKYFLRNSFFPKILFPRLDEHKSSTQCRDMNYIILNFKNLQIVGKEVWHYISFRTWRIFSSRCGTSLDEARSRPTFSLRWALWD